MFSPNSNRILLLYFISLAYVASLYLAQVELDVSSQQIFSCETIEESKYPLQSFLNSRFLPIHVIIPHNLFVTLCDIM